MAEANQTFRRPGGRDDQAATPGPGGALRAVFSGRLRPVWICAAVFLGLLTLVRLGLLLTRRELLAGAVGWGEIARCFLLGARFDAMPIGYALLPLGLALALVPARRLAGRRWRSAVVLYAALAATILAGTEVFGVFFFLRFGRRLNYMAFAYLTHRETLQFMWSQYPLWLLPPVLAGVFWLFRRWFGRWFGSGAAVEWSVRRRLAVAAALAAVGVLACRGGMQSVPLRRGSAYFSDNQLVGELAMNDFYTMFYAVRSRLTDGHDERKAYRLPTAPHAAEVTDCLLHQGGDVPMEHPGNPLWRRSASPNPRSDRNVVLIIMEGMAGAAVGALGHTPSHTPHLDTLCADGLFFERMYAVGARTGRGMVALLCGHPDLGGTTVMKRPRALGRFLTLPEVLRARGYRTLFLCGGRAEFDNMGRFLAAGGVEEIIDQDRMDARAGNWGVPDEVLFRRAHERFEELADEPFFAAVLTVSNHDPFEVPAGRVDLLPPDPDGRNKVLNAYRYADWALGEFFRYARGGRYFENTIFVLIADHGRFLDQARRVDVPGFRIPCVIYAPGIVPPGRLRTVASQTDVPPTVLGLLGGEYEHCFLGRDVLRVPEHDGFALLHEDVHLAFVRDDLALTLPPAGGRGAELFRVGPLAMRRIAPDPARSDALAEEMLAYYTMARHLYTAGAYCSPLRFAETTTAPVSFWRKWGK